MVTDITGRWATIAAATSFCITLAAPLAAEDGAHKCAPYISALTRAKAALVDGDRKAAIDPLKRARSALRACERQSEEGVTAAG
jgi:hypothetical protein